MNIKKELIDQSAHFGIGFGFVLLVLYFPLAICLVIGLFAMYREYRQHNQIVWFNMDLAFWWLGIFSAFALNYFLVN